MYLSKIFVYLRTKFIHEFGTDKPLGEFIRRSAGMDKKSVKKAFVEFLDKTKFSADHIYFVNQIIEHFTQNGVMDVGVLFESPFTDRNDQGLAGIFDIRQRE